MYVFLIQKENLIIKQGEFNNKAECDGDITEFVPVAPTAGPSALLGQVVAQGEPHEFNLENTTENEYLFDKRGLHTLYKNRELDGKDWFKDYFGLKELDLQTQLTTIRQSFNMTLWIYDIVFFYMHVTNITFTIKDKVYNVGDFSCLTLVNLKRISMPTYPVLENKLLDITYKVINDDITYLINNSKPTDVFQAASQLNLLEMPNANTIPEASIRAYYTDNSQGPRVALASPIGTFFRNYLIYNGEPQTSTKQFNTLYELLHLPEFNFESVSTSTVPKQGQYVYSNGYCFINPTEEQSKIAQDNPQLFDQYLKVGVQWNSPLLINYDRKLCQVYCSGLPFAADYAGYYKTDLKDPTKEGYKTRDKDYETRIKPFAIGILKAAFKCTLQVAVNKLGLHTQTDRIKVYLTPVGGGYFGNPIKWVVEALINALIDFRQYPLDVQMVIFKGPSVPAPLNQELFNEEFIIKNITGDHFKKNTADQLEEQFQLYITTKRTADQLNKRKYIKYKTKYLELKTQLGK
jgi:hypothetical protein